MNWKDVQKRIRRAPFEPFRIYLTDGAWYDIRHPDFALVTRREIVVGAGTIQDGGPEYGVSCDPVHIVRIEPLTALSRRNGGRKRK